jgi:hypothetical protein
VALQEINPREHACLCVRITAALSIEAILKYDGFFLDKSEKEVILQPYAVTPDIHVMARRAGRWSN